MGGAGGRIILLTIYLALIYPIIAIGIDVPLGKGGLIEDIIADYAGRGLWARHCAGS